MEEGNKEGNCLFSCKENKGLSYTKRKNLKLHSIYFPSFYKQYLQTGNEIRFSTKIRSDFLTVAAVMMNRIDTKQRWRAFDQKP